MSLVLSGTDGIAADGTTWAIKPYASGLVSMPYRPAFAAWAYPYGVSKTYTGQGTFEPTFTGATITTTVNIGSCFNATNGRFTAPIAGRYFFTGSFSRSAGNATLDIYMNGGSAGVYHLSYGADWQTTAASLAIDLAVNDYVTLVFGATNSTTVSGFRVHFSGFML